MGHPHIAVQKKYSRKGGETPPLGGPLCNTGIAQPEGIGPSVEPSSEPPLRADMASPAPDNGARAEMPSTRGNRHEDGAITRQVTGEAPLVGKAGPSKGKGIEPLEACEWWL